MSAKASETKTLSSGNRKERRGIVTSDKMDKTLSLIHI